MEVSEGDEEGHFGNDVVFCFSFWTMASNYNLLVFQKRYFNLLTVRAESVKHLLSIRGPRLYAKDRLYIYLILGRWFY